MTKQFKIGIAITLLIFAIIGFTSDNETEQKVSKTVTLGVECPIDNSKELISLYEQALALDGQAFGIAGDNMLLIHEAAIAGANMDIAEIENIVSIVEYRTNEVNKIANKKYLILEKIERLK